MNRTMDRMESNTRDMFLICLHSDVFSRGNNEVSDSSVGAPFIHTGVQRELNFLD